MSDMIMFRKVRAPYGWLSNMSPHPIQEYRTAEALFQASRFDDPKIQAEIRACTSPMAAKMTAKRHAEKMIIAPRSEKDLMLMRRIVRLKMGSHLALVSQLLTTGSRLIVEDVSSRPNESGLFWGAMINSGGFLVGQNWLGRIWMELRDELRSAQ